VKKYAVIHKDVGQTPLEALELFRHANPIFADTPLSYAGRLDPMAEGKLLVLIGEECKRQKQYLNLDKEYEVDVLLDVGSDTGDILGRITYANQISHPSKEKVKNVLKKEHGVHKRAYPVFSSKTVNGKPLFLYALMGELSSISIPEHDEHIYKIQLLKSTTMRRQALEQYVHEKLARVPRTTEPSKVLGADFRINDVRADWGAFFTNGVERDFEVLTLRVVCGSGTYMRTLADRIAESLGTKALALRISRTKIGKYWCGVWIRSF